ncbi:hypothetical protein N9L68_09375, partial [bacterium]|nr:hypothetical protein [bacterium]
MGRPLVRGRGLLERRVAPIPQGRMLTVKKLEAVTRVRGNATDDLEAASLADEEGPPLGHRQERALSAGSSLRVRRSRDGRVAS